MITSNSFDFEFVELGKKTGWKVMIYIYSCSEFYFVAVENERETDRQTDRERDRETHRQTDRQRELGA